MTNLTEFEHDIFLSYNRTDEDWTARLAERLEQEDWQGRKIRVYFAPWDISPGQSIPREIERALPKSRKVGLVMSPEAMSSAWVELERLVTTYIDISARTERLIPLLRRDCEIPALVKPLLKINFTEDEHFEENYRRLLAVIKGERPPRRARRPTSTPISLPPTIPRPPAIGFVERRDAEGRDIVEMLEDELAPEKNQLVVLWGAGGVGKTTLAVEAAKALSELFGQRIVWASPELRADFTLATLLDEIAAQLGRTDLRPLPFAPKEEQVRSLLGEAHTLVILDNYETIVPAEQTRCAQWLAKLAPCPALITTRQSVEGGHNISINTMTPEEAHEFVERWIKREARDKAVFEGLERDEIIKSAGRNPLVLQWVLARIDLAGEPAEVLDELMQGEGDAARRVFDASFKLPQLGDDGRDALLALSLFVPDASRDALREVAGFGSDSKKRLNEAVALLSSLWLVETTRGNKRLKIDGLTRELSKAHLVKDARAAEFRQRFIDYFQSYAEAHMEPTAENYDALDAERNNLLAAMDAAFTHGSGDGVIKMAYNLTQSAKGILRVRGYWNEAIRYARQALDVAKVSSNEWFIGALANNLGTTFVAQGNYPSAKEYYELAVQVARKIDAEQGLSATLNELGRLAQAQGELAEARRLYGESLDINKRLGNQNGIAISLHNLAVIAQDQGELKEAQRLYNESLDIHKRLGDQDGIAISLHELGRLAQAQGELAEARRLYGESLDIEKRLGNQSSIASTLHQLGQLAHEQGELAEARRLYGESLDIEKRLGNQNGIAISLWQLGMLAAEEGDRVEATRLLQEALSIFERLKSPYAEIVRQLLELLEGEPS
jgi:tetratricopeptide (TPR) repeat protein